MKRFRAVWVIIAIILLHWGCTTYEYPETQYRPLNTSSISLGMNEGEVGKILGPPADVIGSRYYKGGHVIRVLQYLQVRLGISADVVEKNFYLYFLDGKLVQWGRPGDWEKEADGIYEIRIRQDAN